MTEKLELFNSKWDKLIQVIGNSRKKHDGKNAVLLLDFYFTRAKVREEFDCIVCYKDWSSEVDVPHTNQRATKVLILKHELLDYYLNGWNKTDEIKNLVELYNEHLSTKRYLQETRQFCESKEFLDACQGMRDCKRERDRLKHEKRCVSILLKYMGLTK